MDQSTEVNGSERTFGIGDKELKATIRQDEKTEKAIERLVIERSAMLAIVK